MDTKAKRENFFLNSDNWRLIFEIVIISRILLTLVGWFSAYYEGNVIYQRYIDRGYFLSPHWLIDMWCRWDSEWHFSIANWGYIPSEDIATQYSNLAFFPLYPYIVRLIGFCLPGSLKSQSALLLLGLLVSNLSLLLGLYGLAELVRERVDGKTARYAVILTVCLPCAFFFSAFYSESLFFCLIVYGFLFAQREQWPAGALCSALAALTRPHGVLLLIPSAWIYMSRRGWNFRKIGGAWLWYFLVPAALCGYFFGLYRLTGDFFAFFKAQGSWGRSLSDTSAFRAYFEPLHTRHAVPTTIDLGMILFSFVMSLWMLMAWKDKSWGIYSLACTLVLIGTGNLYSMSRYTAVNFPIWVFTASLLKGRRGFVYLCALFIILQALLFCGWMNYYWIA